MMARDAQNAGDRPVRKGDHWKLPWCSIDNRPRYMVAGLALLVVALYVGLSAVLSEAGLPLDDGWIHQTYARNLVRSGRWVYANGIASAGSTAPLWTLLVAVGYVCGVPPLLWVYLLGWLSLVWLSWNGMSLWSILWSERAGKAWSVGAVLVLSWPFIWASGSGMETLFFAALVMQLILSYSKQLVSQKWNPAILGLTGGLLILVRPEGIALLILVAAGMLISIGIGWQSIKKMGIMLLAAAAFLLPYFAMNLAVSGHWWPNTLYAKQVEYATLWDKSLVSRFIQLLYFTLGGAADGWRGISAAHLLLLPGLVVATWSSLVYDRHSRQLLYSLPLFWAIGHVFLFAWRLPVTYQHGRYLLPAMPIFILYGMAGWLTLLALPSLRLKIGGRVDFIWRSVVGLTFTVILLVFLFLGLQAYVQDVAFINGEMVTIAHWLRENTPPDALVAAHDIGAIGYFAERPLLDLAGLISPEIIPLLNSETALARYVENSEAEYLVTAPGWPYRTITRANNVTLVFQTDYLWTREQGLNNMTAYRLDRGN